MDFEHERYVRIYTRDTITWKRLGWDGQNVLMQMTRRLDRAGALDLGDMEPWEAVVVLCGGPEAAARAGMARCLDLGVFAGDRGRLVAPNYVTAQEAKASGAARSKKWRDGQRRQASQRGVTLSSDEPSPERDASDVSVTPVTPSLAKPNQPSPAEPSQWFNSDDLAKLFSAIREERGGGKYRSQHTDYQRLNDGADWAREEAPDAPEVAAHQSIENYLDGADAGLKAKGWPLWGWSNDPGAWLVWKPPGAAPTAADFDDDDSDDLEEMLRLQNEQA